MPVPIHEFLAITGRELKNRLAISLAPSPVFGIRAGQFLAMLAIALLALLRSLAYADEPPLEVGVIAPMGGDFAIYGQGAVNGMQLANDTLEGKRLKLIVEDNAKCDSPSAVSALQKLTTVHHAKVIVTVCTAAAQGVLPIVKARRIPLIQLTESGADPESVMLKLMPDAQGLITLHADMYVEEYQRLAIVATDMTNNIGERGNVPVLTKAFEASGGQVVLSELVPPDITDFRSIIQRIRRSDAQAVTPFIGSASGMALFLKQADELNLWATKKLAGNFLFEFLFAELSKLYPIGDRLDGLQSINIAQMTDSSFKEAYTARYHTPAPQFADYGYDAVSILKACGVDTLCYRTSRAGVSGQLEFDAQARRSGVFEVKRLRNGNFETVKAVR